MASVWTDGMGHRTPPHHQASASRNPLRVERQTATGWTRPPPAIHPVAGHWLSLIISLPSYFSRSTGHWVCSARCRGRVCVLPGHLCP